MKKMVSWNVNGLRAILGKGFDENLKSLDADIIGLQEIKLQEGQTDYVPEGYHAYWNYAEKKGYSGTAVFSKEEPLSVAYGIGVEEHDHEGRVITLEFENYYFVTVYVPNSQDELKRLDYRMQWEEAFLDYIKKLDAKKPVVYCGDLNVAHEEMDLKNPKTNHMNPGFTDEERAAFTRVTENGFTDSFRALYPEKVQYSWWSYRFHAKEKNIGWRIDYFVVSDRLMEKVRDSLIHEELEGSDHCPIELNIEI